MLLRSMITSRCILVRPMGEVRRFLSVSEENLKWFVVWRENFLVLRPVSKRFYRRVSTHSSLLTEKVITSWRLALLRADIPIERFVMQVLFIMKNVSWAGFPLLRLKMFVVHNTLQIFEGHFLYSFTILYRFLSRS